MCTSSKRSGTTPMIVAGVPLMVIVGVAGDAQGDPRQAHPAVIYRLVLQTSVIRAFNPNLLIETTDPRGGGRRSA